MNNPTMTPPQELNLSQLQQVAGGVQSVEAQLLWEVLPVISVPPSLEWDVAPFI